MTPDLKFRKAWLLAAVVVVFAGVLLAIPCPADPTPDIYVRVSDTTSFPGATSTVSVYLSNYTHEISGFNLWLQLDRPDIMRYTTTVDSVVDTTRWFCQESIGDSCIDSILVVGDTLYFQCNEWDGTFENCLDSTLVPADSGYDEGMAYPAVYDTMYIDTIEILIGTFDTVGTLISGWEHVSARSLSGIETNLNVTGIADMPGGTTVGGIEPQQGGVLIRLQAQVLDIPDSLQDRTVNILIQSDVLSHFNFSEPDGSSVGLAYEEIPDTNCWVCMAWANDVCLNWKRISIPPPGGCDSSEIGVDTLVYIDTSAAYLQNGSVTVLTALCGDINDSGNPIPDIIDLIYLVNYMFQEGPEPPNMWVTDVNCDFTQIPNISDLIYMVTYMFQGGPWCGCEPF
jgi:hypothetical protein